MLGFSLFISVYFIVSVIRSVFIKMCHLFLPKINVYISQRYWSLRASSKTRIATVMPLFTLPHSGSAHPALGKCTSYNTMPGWGTLKTWFGSRMVTHSSSANSHYWKRPLLNTEQQKMQVQIHAHCCSSNTILPQHFLLIPSDLPFVCILNKQYRRDHDGKVLLSCINIKKGTSALMVGK